MSSLPSGEGLAVGFGLVGLLALLAGLIVALVAVVYWIIGPAGAIMAGILVYMVAKKYGSSILLYVLEIITEDLD